MYFYNEIIHNAFFKLHLTCYSIWVNEALDVFVSQMLFMLSCVMQTPKLGLSRKNKHYLYKILIDFFFLKIIIAYLQILSFHFSKAEGDAFIRSRWTQVLLLYAGLSTHCFHQWMFSANNYILWLINFAATSLLWDPLYSFENGAKIAKTKNLLM